jgi:hypothetical protein
MAGSPRLGTVARSRGAVRRGWRAWRIVDLSREPVLRGVRPAESVPTGGAGRIQPWTDAMANHVKLHAAWRLALARRAAQAHASTDKG